MSIEQDPTSDFSDVANSVAAPADGLRSQGIGAGQDGGLPSTSTPGHRAGDGRGHRR